MKLRELITQLLNEDLEEDVYVLVVDSDGNETHKLVDGLAGFYDGYKRTSMQSCPTLVLEK